MSLLYVSFLVHLTICTSTEQYRNAPFPPPAGQEKPKTKKVVDLFLGDDDEDEDDEGDIFSEKSAVQPPLRNKKEAVEEVAKPSEKKVNIHTQTHTCACK